MPLSFISTEELVRVCTDSGQAAAWDEFVRRFHRQIVSAVIRTARRWGESSPQVIEDLVQETYLKFCSNRCQLLREFEARHPEAIYGYVKVVAVNVVHDHFKSLRTRKRALPNMYPGAESVEASSAGDDSKSQGSMERQVLLGQIDRALLRCVAESDQRRSRQIFWLYYRHGLSARAIAELPGFALKTKGVESILFRLTRLVRQEL